MATARHVTGFLLALAAAAAAGCDGSLAPGPCEVGACGTQVSTRRTFQQRSINRQVDLLFVVDDTPAAGPHQETILRGIADMTSAIVNTASLPISLHAGVVRAGGCDATTRGAVCGVQSAEEFVRSEWCNTITNTNVSRTVTEAVTCLGDLGTDDCEPSTPLAAALRALEGVPGAGWEGFLRPGAFLMIVVISAREDASGQAGQLAPVEDLAARTKGLKGDPSQVVVSIIGPESCGDGENGRSRLCQFAAEFGANGIYMALGSPSLAPAVQRISETINIGLRPPCLTGIRDVDPAAPGLQPNCTVTRNSVDPTGALVTSSLPTCDASQPPCWRLGPTASCGSESARVIDIQYEADWCFDAATSFTIECLVCADANDPACAAMTTP